MELRLRPAPLAWIDGRPVWPFLGAEGEEGGSAGGAQSGESGTGGAQSGGTSDGDTGGSTKEGDGERTSGTDTVAREEFERIQRQLSEADKKREAAEKRAKEYEDKDKGEVEKATERAETAEKRVQDLEAEVQKYRLEKAMLTDKDHGADKWHDVDYVLSALNNAVRDGSVTIGDDGTVKGVPAFLKSLASNKKFLLKTTAQGNGGGASGDANNRDRRGGDGDGETDAKARRKKLEENYPSIRR